jgi:LAO/AO transport system kinase
MTARGTSGSVNASGPLSDALIAGDRRALARAVTLVESTRSSDQAAAEALLEGLLPRTGRSIRIGISGAPGVGKSTFIDAFGSRLIEQGRRVAVLAIDPSSRRSGGSILGDKTRMERLARSPNAFISPSPAGKTLGGVARRTREVMLLTEAAGFDVVLVETVGVGQSETAVSDMTDLFVLLVGPGGGDELQGIKRGVMELADVLIVTKADGDLLTAARRAEADYGAALHLMRPKHEGIAPVVMAVSALEDRGIGEVWTKLKSLHESLSEGRRLERMRANQSRRWFHNELQAAIGDIFLSNKKIAAEAESLERAVAEGKALPHAAARLLVKSLG